VADGLPAVSEANATHPKGTPSGGGSPRSWPHGEWVGFCPWDSWMRDGDCLVSPCSQPGHTLEAGADCPCERHQLSPVSHWPTGRANWDFCSDPSSSSALLPSGRFTSCEALPGGDLLPLAAASLVIGLRNSKLFHENMEQTKPSRHSGPVSYVPAPAGTSAATTHSGTRYSLLTS